MALPNQNVSFVHLPNGIRLKAGQGYDYGLNSTISFNELELVGLDASTNAILKINGPTPTGTADVNLDGYFTPTRCYNAVYNDYAECFACNDVYSHSDLIRNIIALDPVTKKAIPALWHHKAVVGVASDSYAYLINGTQKEIDSGEKTAVGMAGTLWVKCAPHPTRKFDLGDFVTTHPTLAGYGVAVSPEQVSDMLKYMGKIVGKIIDWDEEQTVAKILIINR